MSLKASNSSENAMLLPVSDPPPPPPSRKDQTPDDKLFKGSAMTKRGASAAISYMSCAVLLVMFNKAALSSYDFPSANVITLLQMVSSCFFLYVLRRWRIISFSASESLLISDNSTKFVSLKTLKHTLPLSGAYLLYMVYPSLLHPHLQGKILSNLPFFYLPGYFSLASHHGVCSWSKCSNVYHFEEDHSGIYNACRVCFGGAEVYILYYFQAVISVGLIVFGAFVAGARDLSFDAYGYAIVFMSNISTAIYLATIARIGKTSGLNSFGLMWCNGILCGPVLLIWTFIRGDLKTTINFPYLFSPGFIVILLFSCTLAFFLNYSIFLNTTLNSALTQTICGNLKDLFTIGLGWILFGGLPFDFWNVIGQLLGFAGSGLYAYYKLIGK